MARDRCVWRAECLPFRLPAFEWPLPSALMLLADVGLAAGFLLFALVSSPAALAIVGFASLRRKLHAKAL